MTEQEYEDNQKIPERIDSTEKGKQMVINFIDIVRIRVGTDGGPNNVKDFDNKILYKLTHIFFYFTKWVIEYLVDNKKEDIHNSQIWIFSSNDGDALVSHNILLSGDVFKDYKTEKWKRKLMMFQKSKAIKIWRKYK